MFISKKCALWIEKRPTKGIDGHHAGKKKQDQIPIARLSDKPTGRQRKQRRSEISKHVHRAKNRCNLTPSETDRHGIAADPTESSAKCAQGYQCDTLLNVTYKIRSDNQQRTESHPDDRDPLPTEPLVARFEQEPIGEEATGQTANHTADPSNRREHSR